MQPLSSEPTDPDPDRNDNEGRHESPEVAVISTGLVPYLRKGARRQLNCTAQDIAIMTEGRGDINVAELLRSLQSFDAARALIVRVGFNPRGRRPAPMVVTDADHPDLVLGILEREYREHLAHTREAGSPGFTPRTTRQLTELGELVAALRERLTSESPGPNDPSGSG
jgi:hypothetical protein